MLVLLHIFRLPFHLGKTASHQIATSVMGAGTGTGFQTGNETMVLKISALFYL